MYKQSKPRKTTIKRNESYKGETIEQKIFRITNNKEPISDGAPIIYTDRKDGVLPAYNIKTDRWDTAIDAMDKVDKTHKAKREERIGERTYDTMSPEQQQKFNEKFPGNKHAKGKKDGGTEPKQGTQG